MFGNKMLVLCKILLAVVFVLAASLLIRLPVSAADKCDIASLTAMFKYGEMRFEIRQTADATLTLGPAVDALSLVELLGCDMEPTRAGVDCVEDLFPSVEQRELPARVLECGGQVGLRTQAAE